MLGVDPKPRRVEPSHLYERRFDGFSGSGAVCVRESRSCLVTDEGMMGVSGSGDRGFRCS